MKLHQVLPALLRYVSDELLNGDASELTQTTPLLEWGVIDSLSIVTLLAFIEREMGVQIPDEMVRPEYFETLDALANLIVTLGTPAEQAGSGLNLVDSMGGV